MCETQAVCNSMCIDVLVKAALKFPYVGEVALTTISNLMDLSKEDIEVLYLDRLLSGDKLPLLVISNRGGGSDDGN